MTFEKVDYICIGGESLTEKQKIKQKFQDRLVHVMSTIERELGNHSQWIQMHSPKKVYYYNKKVRGLFPDFSDVSYTKPVLYINKVPDINQILSSIQVAESSVSLLTKEEFLDIFTPLSQIERISKHWEWEENFLHQYFCVRPCDMYSDVCRIDGKEAAFWGMQTNEKACIIPLIRLAGYLPNKSWQADILFLMKKNIFPVLATKEEEKDAKFWAEYVDYIQKEDDLFQVDWEEVERVNKNDRVFAKSLLHPVITPSAAQMTEIIKNLCRCDYVRVGLHAYDKSVLSLPNGHWDLWQYVPYNGMKQNELPDPPTGKMWVDVSKENLYARNAAKDLVSAADVVAIDFGTKSTTVARVDNANHIITVPIGEYASKGAIKDDG